MAMHFDDWLRQQGYAQRDVGDAEGVWGLLDDEGWRRATPDRLSELKQQWQMTQPGLSLAQVKGLDDPAGYYAGQGFIPNEYMTDPEIAQAKAWIGQKYGSQYADPRNVFQAFYPGSTLETGGLRMQPGAQPTGGGQFEWNPRDFTDMAWMLPLGIGGAGLAYGGLGGATAAAPAAAEGAFAAPTGFVGGTGVGGTFPVAASDWAISLL